MLHPLGKVLRHPERALLRLVLQTRLARIDPARERIRLLEFLSRLFRVDGYALESEYRSSELASWYRAPPAGPAAPGAPLSHGHDGPLRLRGPVCHGPRGPSRDGGGDRRPLRRLQRAHPGGAGAKRRRCIEEHRAREPSLGAAARLFVPPRGRDRWELILGDSRTELPRILHRLGTIDLFHHDSLHTSEHMQWEYATAFAHLKPAGLLTSHDVRIAHSLREIGQPNAFVRFCATHPVTWSRFHNFGVARKAVL